MAMELEIEEEPEEEEEAPEIKATGAMPAGGVKLKISLNDPTIHVDRLTIEKKEEK